MQDQSATAFMSNRSALGTGKTDCHDMLKQMINDNNVIFYWQEKRVSDNVAQISIVGSEDSSLPVLTFKATEFAKRSEPPNTPKPLLFAISLDSSPSKICKETPISNTDRLPNN